MQISEVEKIVAELRAKNQKRRADQAIRSVKDETMYDPWNTFHHWISRQIRINDVKYQENDILSLIRARQKR